MDQFMDFMESFKLFFDPEVDEYGTEFQPFSRLPTELRLKIWRANWEPKAIWPQNALYAPGDPGYPPPQANLPVTARINQESRNETLRMYQKISHMGLHIFRSYFNVKIDILHLDAEPFHFEELDPHNRYLEACPASICSALDCINLLKIERLDLSSSDYIPETIYLNYDIVNQDFHMADTFSSELYSSSEMSEINGYKTMGNFLHYVKKQYLPSIRFLKIVWRAEPIFMDAALDDLRGLMRPIFFRYREEGTGGLQIVPLPESLGYLMGFEILFLGPREATCLLGKEEPAAKHAGWLEFVGLALWNALSPECFLGRDGINGYLEEKQAICLL